MKTKFTFSQLVEYKVQKKPKKRPPHTLHFTDYMLWAKDAIALCPDVIFIERGDSILAVSQDKETCYGFWMENKGRGLTFKNPRLTSIVVV